MSFCIPRKALLLALTTTSAFAFNLLKRSRTTTSFPRSFVAVPNCLSAAVSSSSSSSRLLSTTATNSADTPATLPDFASKKDYLQYMESVAALPQGFAIGTAEGKFVSVEAPALGKLPIRGTVIHLTEGPTENWAAVFTQNKVCACCVCALECVFFCVCLPVSNATHNMQVSSFYFHEQNFVCYIFQFPGAPVLVGRSRLAGGGPLQALVINNKVSNVCSGGDGVADSEQVCQAVADGLHLSGGGASMVLPSSTGVIGWRLPAQELAEEVVPQAIENLDRTSALAAAQAICTTDRYPKVRSKTLSNGARLVGIAKGAGMIEPNM